ncbi:MAG: peptidylprolyl isomerase [Oricola sp.]
MQLSRSSRFLSAAARKPARSCLLLVLAASCAFALPAVAQDAAPDPAAVIATIDGKEITNKDLDMTFADLQDQLGQVPPEGRRAAALTALIDIRTLATKADAAGLGDSDEFRAHMEFLRQRALHNAYFRQEVVEKVSDEDVRARYDKEVAATPPENEVRARHILLATEEEAKDVIAALDKGGDFEALAKEKSTGPTGPNGGDLGYFTRGRMVPEFEEAAFALDIGAYTKTPVKTQFGWHVIKLEDKRLVQPPAFAEVEGQIRSVLLRERYFQLLSDLRSEAKIEITDPALKESYDKAVAAQQPAQ